MRSTLFQWGLRVSLVEINTFARCRAMREVYDRVWLLDRSEEPTASSATSNIRAIVNLSPTTPNTIADRCHRVPDATPVSEGTSPSDRGYDAAARFIHERWLDGVSHVAVHCNSGFQRSIPFLAHYLELYHGVPIEATVEAALGEPCADYAAAVCHILGKAASACLLTNPHLGHLVT